MPEQKNIASYNDVLSEIDGGACALSIVLGKKGLKTYDQYYSLRGKYCFSKFNEKYGKATPVSDTGIPASIITYWNECDSLLHKVMEEKKITFTSCSFPVKIFRMEDTEKIHAIGKVGNEDCFFEIVFGSQLKKKHKIDVLKKLEAYALGAGSSMMASHDKVFCIVLGLRGEDAETNKILREIERDDVMTKTTNSIKTEGWARLVGTFEDARKELDDQMKSIEGKDYMEIPTNPSNCGFCPFHNQSFKVQKSDGSTVKYVCSGFIHIVT